MQRKFVLRSGSRFAISQPLGRGQACGGRLAGDAINPTHRQRAAESGPGWLHPPKIILNSFQGFLLGCSRGFQSPAVIPPIIDYPTNQQGVGVGSRWGRGRIGAPPGHSGRGTAPARPGPSRLQSGMSSGRPPGTAGSSEAPAPGRWGFPGLGGRTEQWAGVQAAPPANPRSWALPQSWACSPPTSRG